MEIDSVGDAVVYAEGDIDVATSASLQEALAKALETSSSIVFDGAGVRFIDSSGLTALIWGYHGAHEAGGALRVRRPSPTLRRLLEISALDSVMLTGDEDAASPPPPRTTPPPPRTSP